MSYRILILIGVVAAIVGFIFLLPGKSPTLPVVGSDWVVHAGSPEVIGGYGDNLCYDGKGVQTVSGTLDLEISGEDTWSIEASIYTGMPLHPSSSDEIAGTIRIFARSDASSQLRENVDINGDIDDSNLPQTHALVAGEGVFDVYADGKPVYKGMRGEWSLADAVRRGDGSIRQSGLLYSPLLRDKTGFSDPDRVEFTLLLHSDVPDTGNKPPYSAVLHLVFSDVTIEKRPAITQQ